MATRRDPVREWREQYARCCLRVDFEPLPGTTFHASVKPILPELRIIRAALSPGLVFRDEDLLKDGDNSLGFIIARSRELTIRHPGCEFQLGPGDATMMHADTIGSIGSRESYSYYDMLISPAEWEACGAGPEDGFIQRLWGKSDAMQLLRSYIRSLERSGLTAFGNVVRRHIIDLMVLAATPHQSVGESNFECGCGGAASRHLRPHRFALFGSRT
jgi:hypothetical protein